MNSPIPARRPMLLPGVQVLGRGRDSPLLSAFFYSADNSAIVLKGAGQSLANLLTNLQVGAFNAMHWASALVAREHHGPGDTLDAAMWRAEQKWGIERSTFWSLRYRPPRDIVVSVYMRLKAAYEHECERQESRLAHELMLAKAAGLDAVTSRTVAQAESFLGKTKGAPE